MLTGLKTELPKYKNTDTIIVLSNAVHLLTKYFPEPNNVKFDYIRYSERNSKMWDYVIFHIALIPSEDIKAMHGYQPQQCIKLPYKAKHYVQ